MLKRTPVGKTKIKVTFTLPLNEPPGSVSVVGSFNEWQPGRHELVPRRQGVRSIPLVLPPGTHRFRYLATGGVWTDDHEADTVDDHGSVVVI